MSQNFRQMSKKALVAVVISWVIYQFFAYYFLPYFIVTLFWLLLSLLLLIFSIIHFIKLIIERKSLSKLRIQKFITFTILFVFTVTNLFFPVLEKFDWIILYNNREEIVEKVKNGELKPNVEWNKILCELPFDFPVISNGGNDILIFKNENSVTVQFWTYRNFFSAPSTSFVYTDNTENIKYFEEKINTDPDRFWKLKSNWYRIYEND